MTPDEEIPEPVRQGSFLFALIMEFLNQWLAQDSESFVPGLPIQKGIRVPETFQQQEANT